MRGEPVRGGFPEPGFDALPGIERAQATLRGLVPRSPLSHLVGYRVSQVGSGTATLTMPASPWLDYFDGTLDVKILGEEALALAVLTGSPAGHNVRTVVLTFKHLRPATVDSASFIARARTLNQGPRFAVAEVLVEDVLGRAIAHATASAAIRPSEDTHAPPALQPVEEPVYPTPDPHLRPSRRLLQPTSTTRPYIGRDLRERAETTISPRSGCGARWRRSSSPARGRA